MSNPEAIEERLVTVIRDHLDVAEDRIFPASRFEEDLGADSLDVLELIMAIEEEFDIEIHDDAAYKIKTVQNASDFIKLAQAAE